MHSLWTAIGLVLVIEGLTYALVPRKMKSMMASLINLPDENLRMMGVVAMAVGVGVVFLVRAILGAT
ncbi:MAG: DUF2065 domain-containing protein [Alphaproteobacteria bacterium]|nr:DUF2065 domain-containing protein [Alphaproteobacteria bacterium]